MTKYIDPQMERKTLGGSKKFIFAPKKQDNSEIPTVTEKDVPKETAQLHDNIDNKSKQIPRPRVSKTISTTVFTGDGGNSKGTSSVFLESRQIAEEMRFKEANEPQHIEKSTNNPNKFEEDILYLFNGFDNMNGKVVLEEDGQLYYIEDGNKCAIIGREIEKVTAVNIDDNVHEIGDVFYCYSLHRNDI